MSTQTVFKTAGSTSQTIDVALVQKAAATSPGDPLTGITYNGSGFVAYYRKGATGTLTQITLATQTVGGAYSSGGFVEVSSTNAPGLYRFDIPDTVIATAGIASITFSGFANLATHTVYIIVTAVDLYDSVRGGMTALPNAAAGASGGLHILGTNSTAVSYTGGMTISNASGSALTLSSSGSNGNGLAASGNGTGDGIAATAGATGRGIHAIGGATSGAGIRAEGTAGNANALELAGQGSAHGLSATGGATGNGILATGGATSGSAVKAVGTAGNAIALELVGQGSAAGLKTSGGATGNGASFIGGATSGHGIQATVTSGNEIDADITGTLSALSSSANTAVANAVWDTAAASHATAGSFGAMLQTPHSGTAQAGGATTITLASGASATNDYYKNDGVYILSGTGVGQFRFITGYVGATKVATVSAWATNPDNTSVYILMPFGAIAGATAPTASENAIAVWDELRASHTTDGTFGQYFQLAFRSGTAQAGTSSSITLDSGASATNDLYKLSTISIIGGTGAKQSRQISSYTGSSKVATVGVNWTVNPSSDSVFLITPLGVDAATIAAIAAAVWDEARSGHGTAGTYGEYVPADATRLAGNATAATNAKSAFDGATGYNFVGSVMPSVTTVTGNVNGNVGGSVASVTGLTASDVGAIKTKTDFLPSATAGAAGGVFIAGSNAATSITTALTANITGNVTGNLSGSVGSVTGAVGSVTGAVGSVTGNVGGSVGSLAAQAQTDVKTQAVAALATDTYAEPSSVPAATSSLKDKIAWLFTLNRNKSTQTATTRALRNDADSGNIATAAVSDDSTTAVRAEWS